MMFVQALAKHGKCQKQALIYCGTPTMAASFDAPACKLIFEKSNFKHNKTHHRNVFDSKIFNHAVTFVVPGFEKVPEEITSVLDREPYWIVRQLPLSQIIEREFIEAFVKRGDLYMISHGTHIDTDNTFAVTPGGDLILDIDKDMYEELGLEGKLSEFSKKRKRRYVVSIRLTAPFFTPGKKNHNRVKWCLTDRLNLRADFLFYWKPHESTLCPSSLSSYLSTRGHSCSLYTLRQKAQRSNFRTRPEVCPTDAEETAEHCGFYDFWEWLGAQATGAAEGDVDNYVNTLVCPSPQVAMDTCAVTTFSGLIPPHQIHTLIDVCREHLTGTCCPWVAVTVHGFADSPVSWAAWQHGFHMSGDNLYSVVVFPRDDYWLYMSSATHDTFS